MSSENTTAAEAPAREPVKDTLPKEDAQEIPQSQQDARDASEDSARATSGEPESTGSAGEPSESPEADDTEQGEIPEDPPLPNEAPPGINPPLPNEAPPGTNPPLPDEAPPGTNPPLPNEGPPGTNPPLPAEPAPDASDDGWDYRWDYPTGRYIFFNRITGAETFDNPRIAAAPTASHPAAAPAPPEITGYNPAIHGDYDPNAWYAKLHEEPPAPASHEDPSYAEGYDATALFNRFTGQHQTEGAGRHSDEAKSRRQMNAYFDVDAAANAHDGRSLKAERSGKKPSRNELKFFKEKRKARKEEKRRAWLRD